MVRVGGDRRACAAVAESRVTGQAQASPDMRKARSCSRKTDSSGAREPRRLSFRHVQVAEHLNVLNFFAFAAPVPWQTVAVIVDGTAVFPVWS